MRIIGNAGKAREVQAVASGALSTGDTVVVNSDGTVSVVEEGLVFNPSAGSNVAVGSISPNQYDSVFDTNSNKVVIVYSDLANSDYGTAVVGTVSGTSISFGTPVVFESGNTTAFSLSFDSASNKVVIIYRYVPFNRPRAVVATVSGTSISFGSYNQFFNDSLQETASTFDSNSGKVVAFIRESNTSSDRCLSFVGTVSGTSISFGSSSVVGSTGFQVIASTFDSTLNKVVLTYSNSANSYKGTAVVGTVSGTSISFGSTVVFNDSSTFDITSTYDSSAGKVVVSFRDEANSNRGGAVVGTVSGTSVSFGSKVNFTTSSASTPAAIFDPISSKIVIAYADGGNSSHGTIILGTVSGTSISFGTPIVFKTAASVYPSMSRDNLDGKVVVMFDDSSTGTAQVFSTSELVPNLTSDNYIGTAATGTPDGKAAKINIKGAVDENQSGLTAGQSYYVQTDGTLGTTPADPSVFAGTAVAATKLIVKG
jgi:hypothetical protein